MARSRTNAHPEAISKIPTMDPVSLQDQGVVDSILAQIRGGSGHHG